MLISDIVPYARNARDNARAVPVVAESIREFFFVNALGMCTGIDVRQLSARYPSLEELLNAPELDGKSFMERYDELFTCDFVKYLAD